MAEHQHLGNHDKYGPVMVGPKGGLYIIYNGKKYYGTLESLGGTFTKAPGVSDAVVKAASAKSAKTPKSGNVGVAAGSGTGEGKGQYKSFAENKAANPSWSEKDQIKHANETGSRDKLAKEKYDYHSEKVAAAKKAGNKFEEDFHQTKLDKLGKTPEGKDLVPKKKKPEEPTKKPEAGKAEAPKGTHPPLPAPKAAPPLSISNGEAGHLAAAIGAKLPVVPFPSQSIDLGVEKTRSLQELAGATDRQKSLIKSFTADESTSLRKAARGLSSNQKYIKEAEEIDQALAQFGTKQDRTTYRGMSLSSSQVYQLLTHDVYFNTGPTSSSVSTQIARQFAGSPGLLKGTTLKGYDGHPAEHAVIIKHRNPTGVAVTSVSVHQNEREVMLRHNQQYRVVHRSKTDDGYYMIEEEAI